MLVKGGEGGDEVFMMPTGEMMRRSTWFARDLSTYQPGQNRQDSGLAAPDCDVATFEYYKRCVEQNNADLHDDDFEKNRAGTQGSEDGSARAHKTKDERSHDHTTALCKGYILSAKLGDCKTANLIMDAIIDHLVNTNTLLSNDHVALLDRSRQAPHRFLSASRLWYLALDLRAFANLREYGNATLYSVQESRPEFAQDLRRTVVASDDEKVGQVRDCPPLVEGREIYYCYNKLHPEPPEMRARPRWYG